MENEIEKLEEEILILKKRVSSLEGKENKRKAFNYLKAIIKIIVFVALVFGIWKGYDYFVHEIPGLIKNEINNLNPLKKD